MARQKKTDSGNSTSCAVPRCHVETTLEVIGGKWKPMILWHLLQGTKRFSDLRRVMPQVTQQMLTSHLRQLEQHGIVHREVYAQVPPKVEYSMTDLGKSLEQILGLMQRWGEHFAGNADRKA